MGIRPTQVNDKNIVPTNNLSATGSRKLPSFDACDVQVRAIQPSAKSDNPANPSNQRATFKSNLKSIIFFYFNVVLTEFRYEIKLHGNPVIQ